MSIENSTPLYDFNFRKRALWAKEKSNEAAQFKLLDWYLEEIFSDLGIISNDIPGSDGQDQEHGEGVQSGDKVDVNLDKLEALRFKSTAINRKLLIKDMQLQVLCRVVEWRQAEVADLRMDQLNNIQQANAIVHDERRGPRLPVEIILRIFALLHWSDKRSKTIKKLLDDPDTPSGWRDAIRKELPLVIAEEEGHLEKCLREIDLGPKPSFFPLDGESELVVHQTNYLSLALVDIPANREAFVRVLQLPLRQLTLNPDVSWQNNFLLENMLADCWSIIPRLRKLVLKQDAPFSRTYVEAVALSSHEDLSDLKGFEGNHDTMRVAAMPMAFLRPLTPVLCKLEELELTIPPHVVEFSALAAILKLLPTSLLVLRLCDSSPFWKDPPRFADAEPQSQMKLFNLKELRLTDFAPVVCKAIMRTIICPQLETFSFHQDKRYERGEEPLEFSFVSDVYPGLRVLHLYSPDLIPKPSILEALLECDEGGNWLLPKLDTIIVRAYAVDVFQMLTRIVEARLDSENVASIQSLTLKEGLSAIDDHLLYSLYVGHLSLLVPNLVLLTYRDEYY